MRSLSKWLLPMVSLAVLSVAAPAHATAVNLCTETDAGPTAGDSAAFNAGSGGCINSGVGSEKYIASDGEVAFLPFGLTHDVSDAIALLHGAWLQTSSGWSMSPVTWTAPTTGSVFDVWYLPAVDACGAENEGTCETVGKWVFTSGVQWPAGTPDTAYIYEQNGGLSDELHFYNDATTGLATLTFDSAPIPEPTTMALLGTGLLVAGWRRRKSSPR
jgi:hypothetical protein